MEFQTLKQSHLKRNIIIGVVVVAIISAIVLNFTRAKYVYTDKMPLINGTVNYSLADLNIVAIYVDGTEVESLDSSKQYTLDTEQSTCTYKDGSIIEGLSISYETDTGSLSISPFTTKGTKCTLYYDGVTGQTIQDILAEKTIATRTDFSNALTTNTTGTMYQTTDWDGTTYYFAGVVDDNWVKFAGFYWRIIRVNGDGTLRLIYSGSEATGPQATGSGTQIGTSQYNSFNNYSYYVGLSYDGTQHGTGTASTILTTLNDWYNGIESSSKNYIDSNSGFCSDRNTAGGYSWSASGNPFYYSAYERLYAIKSPNLNCSSNDILNIPVGLITADEVAYAGGVYLTTNQSYYLYTGQSYWTMSPYDFNGINVDVFSVLLTSLFGQSGVNDLIGVRPVINLRADTQFTGTGTSTDPYVVI